MRRRAINSPTRRLLARGAGGAAGRGGPAGVLLQVGGRRQRRPALADLPHAAAGAPRARPGQWQWIEKMHAQQAQMLARVRMQMQAQQPAKNADARGPRQAPASGAELTRERSGEQRRAAARADAQWVLLWD